MATASLPTVVAAHDDAALEALSSKGLLRRARRDLDGGRAEILEWDESRATVVADGQRVTIDTKGPSEASCDCPARGVCRHVLLAMLALRDASGAVETQTVGPPGGEDPRADDVEPAKGLSAREEVCAVTDAQLKRFAGAEWGRAVALAAGSQASTAVENEASLVVALADSPASVTFIAGHGLKGAVVKGPKTRTRAIVAAAALLVRERAGIVAEVDEQLAAAETLSAEFLEDARTTLERAVAAVLVGASPAAADLLFDLAVSARAVAAPRVSAELRNLVRQATLAPTRHVSFHPDEFLMDAARTCALFEALKSAPDDTALTGVLRRDYRASDALDLCLLGASRWQSVAGARGITAFGYAPDTSRWHTVTMARGPGMDPAFNPVNVYEGPLWAAGAMRQLMGRTVSIPQPKVAADGSIAPTLDVAATLSSTRPDSKGLRELLDEGVAISSWSTLFADLETRFGRGLRRGAVPIPVLVTAAGFGAFFFDELEQRYEWELLDGDGACVTLCFPSTAGDTVLRLRAIVRRIRYILLEAAWSTGRVLFRPVAIFTEEKRNLKVTNLDFDPVERAGAVDSALQRLGELVTRPTAPALLEPGAVARLATAALDAAVAVASRSRPLELDALVRHCEDCGLLSLANSLRHMTEAPSVGRALATAFLAGELQALLQFGPKAR